MQKQKISHGRKKRQKRKNLPRINTEFHGNKTLHSEPDALATGIRISIATEFHGNKTLLSEPDALATV